MVQSSLKVGYGNCQQHFQNSIHVNGQFSKYTMFLNLMIIITRQQVQPNQIGKITKYIYILSATHICHMDSLNLECELVFVLYLVDD